MRPLFASTSVLAALALEPACSGESAPVSASPEALATSPQALSLLSSLQQHFVLPAPTLPVLPGRDTPMVQGSPRALLGESHAERWSLRDGWLRPELPDHRRRGITRPASVRLPTRASGAFELTDDTSGMRLSVMRVGAQAAEAEQAEGWAVYRGGLGAGADVLHRATAEGTEDFVHFASRPEKEELRYRVDVSGVAGLRLVSNVLEFVNSAGDPRLRMTAPMLVDGEGKQRELKVVVEGCAYSSDPTPPWGKAVVGPGASECEVVVRWEAGASYPLLVDPNWTASGNMVQQRLNHTASKLLDGSILAVGGGVSQTTSEVWKGGTWAASGNTVQPRYEHAASALPDGRVLVVGGGSSTTSEVWTNGVWTASGNLVQERYNHAISVLADGRVLVVGGLNPAAQQTSEVWANGVWTASGNTTQKRYIATASLLPDGRVLVVGGGTSSTTSEVWKEGVWTASGNTVQQRYKHAASVLPDGRVLVVGGQGSSATSEVWKDGVWTASGNLVQSRQEHTASVLLDGRVLVVGGLNSAGASEVWTNGAWAATGSSPTSWYRHTASVLSDGRVLVVGGVNAPMQSAIWSEDKPLGQACVSAVQCNSGFCSGGVCCDTACTQPGHACIEAKTGKPTGQCGPIPNGKLCSQGGECASGFCADGVCCDSACGGTCQSCLAAKKGQGADGTCDAIKSGSDPDSECTVLGAGLCQTAGFCDGTGQCESKKGLTCGQDACSGDGTTQLNLSSCDASGTCIPNVKNCAPYACQGIQCLTSCAQSTDCQAGYFCKDSKCEAAADQGKACGKNSECGSGFCVDGVCCNEACTGACRACSTPRRVLATTVCQDILAGSDPDDDCAEQPASTCGASGACDGKGACAQHAQGTACGATSCLDGEVTGKVCDGQGTCKSSSEPVSCFPYNGCADASVCASSCGSDNDCATNHFCDQSDNPIVCRPDLPDGVACDKNSQCASGFCADGVCCNAACDGPCEACKVGDNDPKAGICRAVSGAPQAGHPACPGSGECKGVCDGVVRDACVFPGEEKGCGGGACAGGQVTGNRCNGSGTCVAGNPVSCFPYLGCADGSTCATSCGSDNQCEPGHFCDVASKKCEVDKADGEACKKSSECASGFCVDEVCCDTACDGGCQFCATAENKGVCTTLKSGKPLKEGVDCGNDPTCGGECKGNPTGCLFPAQGLECGASACASADTVTLARVCDGSGKCEAAKKESCAPFVCDSAAGSCKTKCSSDKDCATGAVCAANGQCTLGEATCADEHTAKGADGKLTKCDPYTCLNGQCRSTCATDLECSNGFVCQGDKCAPEGAAGSAGSGAAGKAGGGVAGSAGSGVSGGQGGAGGGAAGSGAAAAPAEEEGSCGCRSVGSSSPQGAGAVGLLALAAAARRRRARG